MTYYRVNVTDDNSGCSDPTSQPVIVTVLDDPTVNVTIPDVEVCIGAVATLTANISGGSGALTIQWQSSPGQHCVD